jgi:hypothetical protein
MVRSRIILFLAVAAACAFAAAASPQEIRCPEGHPETGDIGISHLLCVAGSCSVNLRTDRGYSHDFSTEPRIRGVEKDGPSWGRLQDGDVLVAVDGVLITTREGGRRLANLTPGRPVALRIRRADKEMDVTLIPKLGCNMPNLAVLGGGPTTHAIQKTPRAPEPPPNPGLPRPPQPSRRVMPPVDFGMEIDCGNCGWRRGPDGTPIFATSWEPKVMRVEPGGPADQAGLRPRDILLKIDGEPITSPAAAELLGRLEPDQAVILEVGRAGSLRRVQIVPRRPTATGQRF